MNTLLNRLFGLGELGFGAEGVEFGFARPLPPWAWFLAAVLAAALAWYSYWRQEGRRDARLALTALRALALLAILFVISGPQLVRPNERIDRDWIVALIDRSSSLTIPDAPASSAPGQRTTRHAQLEAALAAAQGPLAEQAAKRNVLWLGFDAGAFDLPRGEGAVPRLDEPAGRRTALGAALDQALARVAARPVAGVVVLSDGRSADEPSRAALKRLAADQIPVLALPLGDPEPVSDLALASAQSPSMAFVDDVVPVQVQVDRLGGSAARPPRGKVQLLDKATGQVLDERPLPEDPAQWDSAAGGGSARVTLATRQRREGEEPTGQTLSRTWVVRVVPEGPDLIPANNDAELPIELVDRQLRVLYIDGYPRWEHRFLKSLLLRERSIRATIVLLAANRQYLQEGDVLLDSLPRSPEEWAPFDVVVLGDLPGSLLGREQMENLREHVAARGAGLLWIAGPSATPGAWRDTPLADLLPLAQRGEDDSAADVSGVPAFAEPVLMAPTPAADRLGVLRLADETTGSPAGQWPPMLTDPRTPWAAMRWAQRLDPARLKPTAEVLATFTPASQMGDTGAEQTPAVVTMRFGAGRIMYVATDETWRWRYARGEPLSERFWLPLVRLQGRDALARSSRPATLEVLPRRPSVDQAVSIAVRLQDQALVDAAPARLTARVRPLDPSDPRAATPAEVALAPESTPGARAAGRAYLSTWTPTEPGRYRVEITDAALATAGLSADVEVTVPDDELRHPESDHALLARLVAAGGDGSQVITPAQLGELDRLLPRRDVHVAGTPDVRTLWDTPPILALLLALLTLEWVGRRLLKLS